MKTEFARPLGLTALLLSTLSSAALAQGLGAVQYEGKMIDIASVRIVRNLVERADRIGM